MHAEPRKAANSRKQIRYSTCLHSVLHRVAQSIASDYLCGRLWPWIQPKSLKEVVIGVVSLAREANSSVCLPFGNVGQNNWMTFVRRQDKARSINKEG